MTIQNDMLTKYVIAQAFSAAASTYDNAAFVEQEIASRLLERLAALKLKPKNILDLGCGTGYHTKALQALFPQASIIGIDIAFGMVKFANKSKSAKYTCGDAEQLPFVNQAFDLVFSNCSFMLINNLDILIKELQRVLTIDGTLMFSTLGPDTLKELAIEETWLDMHHIGDALLKAQLKNPVMDVEIINFTYPSLRILLQDLSQTGAYEIDALEKIENIEQPCTATFEVIYGYAQNTKLKQFVDSDGRVFVPLDSIKCL